MRCFRSFPLLILVSCFLISSVCADWEIDDRWEIDSRWEIEGYPPTPPAPSISYPSYQFETDGNCLMYGGIHLKPNTNHTYIPQFNGRYENITLDSGMLRLSKGTDAYEIESLTNDVIIINLNKWFHAGYGTTEFRASSETESSLVFQVNTRARGEPDNIRGVSTWSFNEDTTILTLTCQNYSLVSFFFYSEAQKQFDWFVERTLVWMGMAGFALMVITPVLTVFFLKSKEYEYGAIISLMGFALGFAMMVAWLWG